MHGQKSWGTQPPKGKAHFNTATQKVEGALSPLGTWGFGSTAAELEGSRGLLCAGHVVMDTGQQHRDQNN